MGEILAPHDEMSLICTMLLHDNSKTHKLYSSITSFFNAKRATLFTIDKQFSCFL